jgi:hypothetical protein
MVSLPSPGGFFERPLSEVVDRLTRLGYPDSFRAEPGGLRATGSGLLHAPEDLVVEASERFEGISDPEDMAIVLALRCRAHGCRGTYVTPYGKDMPSPDAELMARLSDARKR